MIAGRNNCQHVVSTRVAGCDRSLSRVSKGARANNCHGPRFTLTRHWYYHIPWWNKVVYIISHIDCIFVFIACCFLFVFFSITCWWIKLVTKFASGRTTKVAHMCDDIRQNMSRYECSPRCSMEPFTPETCRQTRAGTCARANHWNRSH